MTTAALVVALALLLALAGLQVALIRGAPLGEYAWGGQHRVLPPRLRPAAVVAIALYGLFAAILLARAGIIDGGGGIVVVATWVLLGYLCLGVVLNAISRSRRERIVQTPLSLLLALCVLVLALGS